MEANTAIEVKDVSKVFRIYTERPMTLKDSVIFGNTKKKHEAFHALNNVTFSVKKGTTLGLIGKNGCGKSTMLKIINKTMYPSSGTVEVSGRVSSLIELGAGFHPDLTGIENIYTNATVFGLTKSEIEQRIPSIIEFSELGSFIYTPIRTYSSGMYARLAFSVAISVDADILLIDEILGVGDVNFQKKCNKKIHELQESGTTIIIVTHDMESTKALCTDLVWLDRGNVVLQGDTKYVFAKYSEKMEKEQNANIDPSIAIENMSSNSIVIQKSRIINTETSLESKTFFTGDNITIEFDYDCIDNEVLGRGVDVEFSITTIPYNIMVYTTSAHRQNIHDFTLKEKGKIQVIFPELSLLTGEYHISLSVYIPGYSIPLLRALNITKFTMVNNNHDLGVTKLQHTIKLT